jgi:hypothetical protein
MMHLIYLAAFAATPVQCPPVTLSAEGRSRAFIARFANNSDGFRKTSANFTKAYGKACSEGLLKAPLIGAESRDRRHLFLHNAPNANVASIYTSGGRAVLEYPFVVGGKVNVPSVDELHEAIFCAVHGASAKEQQESGRCLPD